MVEQVDYKVVEETHLIPNVWLWAIESPLDKKRRQNKNAERAAGDWILLGKSGKWVWLTEIHQAVWRQGKRNIQHWHMLFPFPLIRSQKSGCCAAQLHMKQCSRGLQQRQAISGILINLSSCGTVLDSTSECQCFSVDFLWNKALFSFSWRELDENIETKLTVVWFMV